MLFDLQGPRKTAVKVIYLGLAILMAGGLVLFGIGSSVNGGLANVFSGEDSTSAAKDNVNKYSEQLAANPKNEKAMQSLIAARYSLAGDPANFNPENNEFSADGKAQLELLKDDWADYLKMTDNKPDLATANYAVSAYLGLEDAKGATAAQQIITERKPNAANYLALMLYASYAGDTIVASGAEVQAERLATKDEKKDVAQQIKEIKEQIGDRNEQIQKQIQEQFAQQSQGAAGGGAPANPFGGIGGTATQAPGQ
ncbi:MAG: hypothetical protein JHD02_08610 [Thermoleophilaceae bacterium]|nr:hypothetical protein [Thermoleophilaceae bacterium]